MLQVCTDEITKCFGISLNSLQIWLAQDTFIFTVFEELASLAQACYFSSAKCKFRNQSSSTAGSRAC